MSLLDKRSFIEMNHSFLSVGCQTELLGISRSGLYYAPRISEDDIRIMNTLDEIYTACPFYGSRRMVVELARNHEINVCRDHVRRLMAEMGLTAIYPKKQRRYFWNYHQKRKLEI